MEIITGGLYRYICKLPIYDDAGKPHSCYGRLYEVIDSDVIDVPSYQRKILMRALDGPDQGLRFTITPSNFSYRYEQASAEDVLRLRPSPTSPRS